MKYDSALRTYTVKRVEESEFANILTLVVLMEQNEEQWKAAKDSSLDCGSFMSLRLSRLNLSG